MTIPEGIDDRPFRDLLLNDYQMEIGGGLGVLAGRIWRVGLMGASSTESKVDACVDALRGALTGGTRTAVRNTRRRQ